MKLVFYSGGDEEENLKADQECLKLLSTKDPTFVFIPSSSYDGEIEFQDFVMQYEKFGISKFLYFPVDIPQDSVLFKEVFNSDLIHLGGGNTYYFLKFLRQSNLFPWFQKFVENGGILTGLSAGGILMTPNIHTAGYPDFDRDENEDNVKNLKALNLVKFEFFPHYKNSPRYEKELLKQSKRSRCPIYALPDGSAIVKDGEVLMFVGKAWAFSNGKKILINF